MTINAATTLKVLAAAAATLFLAGFLTKSSVEPPDHAIVFANPARAAYVSPPCIAGSMTRLNRTTMKRVRELNYRPDGRCDESRDFTDQTRSISGALLEHLGLIPPKRHRWNTDGTWNW